MPIVDLRGEPFNVRVDGPAEAPALLLSNSLSSDLTMWEPQLPAWSQCFRIVRYDQRGHGRSVAPDGAYSIAQLAEDALAVLDHLGIERAHWCGLSMGGMVGMWALTHAPERIGRAVLANTAPHMGPRELWDGRIRTAERGGMAALVDATIERWFTRRFIESAPETIATVRSMILGTPAQGYIGSCAAIRDMDQRETIRAIANPTLVLIGAHDPATTPADGQLIHQAIAGSRTATLDAAHISNIEQPHAFAKAVMDFLVD